MSHVCTLAFAPKSLAKLTKAAVDAGFVVEPASKIRYYHGEQSGYAYRVRVPNARYELGIREANGRYYVEGDLFDMQLAAGYKMLVATYAMNEARTIAQSHKMRIKSTNKADGRTQIILEEV